MCGSLGWKRFTRYTIISRILWVGLVCCGSVSTVLCFVRFYAEDEDVDVSLRVFVYGTYALFGLLQLYAGYRIIALLHNETIDAQQVTGRITPYLYWFAYIGCVHFVLAALGSFSAYAGFGESVKLHNHNKKYLETPLGTLQRDNDDILLALSFALLVHRALQPPAPLQKVSRLQPMGV